MKRLFIIILMTGIAGGLFAQKTTLSGTFTGLPQGARLVLSEASDNKLKPVDTVRLDGKNSFKVTLKHKEPTLYVLQTTARDGAMCHLLLEPKDKVTVNIAYIPLAKAPATWSCTASSTTTCWQPIARSCRLSCPTVSSICLWPTNTYS